MKILHLITSIDRGGAENHLSCLARGQKLQKHDVSIIYLKGNNYWKKYFKSFGIKTINLSTYHKSRNNFIEKILFIRRFIIKNKIEILHSHLPHMELISYLVLMFFNFKLKYFITKHVDNNFFGGSKFKNHSVFADLINYILTKKAKKIICISQAVERYYSNSYFKFDKDKYKIIYYGIDKEYSNQLITDKRIKKIPKKAIVFGSVGRLVKQKNFELIIESYKEFTKKTKKDSCFVIAGDGPEKKRLKKFAKILNIDQRIIWMGHVENVGSVLKKIDVFCMNSRFEGLGLVMLEAMFYSKPIIGPKISAIPEVVQNMQNGILVDQMNTNRYTNAMLKLSNKRLRIKLSAKSKLILAKKFSFKDMVNKTIKIYSN